MLTFDDVVLRQGGFELRADFEVPEGTRVALLGPSGAGKSTLLQAVAGFLAPVSGRLMWRGRALDGTPPGERPLSIVFQEQNLFPHLTAEQNVGLGLDPQLRLTAAERAEVAAALERVGLAGFGGRKPGRLSGGQQSRVALARVLLRGRPLLLLDEPFAALGPALKAEMLDLVIEVATDTRATLLMVTHEPADALKVTPSTVLVAEGRAHAPQPTAALLADPPPALRAYLG